MSLIDEARKLDAGDFALAIGAFISVVAPGFLTLYLFKPTLIGSLDTFKLLIFSASLTLPVAVINFAIASLLEAKEDEQIHAVTFLLAMGMSCLVLYLALLISYLAMLTFKWYLVTIVGLQILLLLLIYLDKHYSKKT